MELLYKNCGNPDDILRDENCCKMPHFLKYAVEHGASKESMSHALQYLSNNREESTALALYLIEHGASVTEFSPIIDAVYESNIPLIKVLVDHGADIHFNEDEAILIASEEADFELIKFLVEHGIDIHKNEEEALMMSASDGDFDISTYLIEHGANFRINDDECLVVACRSDSDNVRLIKYLVERGSDIGGKLPECISRVTHIENAKYLVGQGASVTDEVLIHLNQELIENTFTEERRSRLLELLEYLVDQGGNIGLVDIKYANKINLTKKIRHRKARIIQKWYISKRFKK